MKIVIVDDEPKIRRGIGRWIKEYNKDFQVLLECSNSEYLMENYHKYQADVFLLDIEMEGKNGLELARFIRAKSPSALIVIITGYDYFQYAHESIKIGVFDFLLKPLPKTDFFKLLEKIELNLYKLTPLEKNMEAFKDEESSLSSIVTRARAYIENNYYEKDLSLEKLAEKLNIQKNYLSKLMKKELGYSFIEYLTKIRIEKAKELLKEDMENLKMYQVSDKVGYQSQHYFSRIFRKIEGISPLDYKNNI